MLVLAERIALAQDRCDGTWEGLRRELARLRVTTYPVLSRRTGGEIDMRYSIVGDGTPAPMRGQAMRESSAATK